ncbi:MAG: DUF2269 family protein [Actinobacteria bacterium]|nr:DUF2269 family protein [Actinomycetota bacterium]
MRIDQALLTVHLLAVATWIGAALALQVIAARTGRADADPVSDHFALDAEAVGKLLFAPSSILLLITGAALVERQDLAWSEPWIVLGVVALLVAGAVGGAFLIPEGRRIAALAKEPGHDPAEVRARARRRFLVARIDLAVLVLAVADMVFRPGA